MITINGKKFFAAPDFWEWAHKNIKPETLASLSASRHMLNLVVSAHKSSRNTDRRERPGTP